MASRCVNSRPAEPSDRAPCSHQVLICERRTAQISALYQSVLPLSPLQSGITSSLDYIESQQSELSSVLDAYEAQIGDLVDQSAVGAGAFARSQGGGGGGAGGADKEREQAYALATQLSNSLDTTSSSLSSLIQTLNALSPALVPSSADPASKDSSAAAGGGGEDPLAQIAAILNAHLGSLKWIEDSTDALRRSVRDLEGRVGDVQGRIGARAGAGAQGTPARLAASQAARASPFARRM